MTKLLLKGIDFSWFFISLLGFIVVLPFSHALVSIFGGVVLFVALAEDNRNNKIARFKDNLILLSIPSIFLIYVLSFILFYRNGNSLYDFQKAMFFLVLPVAFMLGKPLSNHQKRFLFYAFALAVLTATIVALFKWFFNDKSENFGVHSISLISHIRFSFQLILVSWFLVILILNNKKELAIKQKSGLLLLTFYFIGFLFFQQSLTGIFAFSTSVLFYLVYVTFQIHKKYRFVLLSAILVSILLPVFYISNVIYSFYNIDQVDRENIDKNTSLGNFYEHDFNNKAVENGHYTYLYICHDEMRAEWNKISDKKYDEVMTDGFPLYSTLIRYLTSKGLRKDASGIKSLSERDIENIENGMVNIIYQKKYSLYPRIYQSVWEYYMYSETDNPNYQSLSQRIEFSKAAISIIKQNFWFGVGTGNWKQEFAETYKKSNSKLAEELYASSHNQYLNYMVKFGITGLLIILFLLLFPVVKTKSYNDPLFLVFLVFMFFANFADSNFESHMGSSFFIFFYCLFIIPPRESYLHLSKV